MKKEEIEFLRDFSDSFQTKKSFKDIQNKINIERFEKRLQQKMKFSFAKLSILLSVLLLILVIIPISVFLVTMPKVVGLKISNQSDLVIEYQKNCNFIESGILVEKKMSNGKTLKAKQDEIVVDYTSFNANNVGKYYISIYLKNKPKIATGYYVNVTNDEITSIQLSNYRDTYCIGEAITPEDVMIKKNLSNGKAIETKITEYSIDMSNFNNNEVGKYDVNIILNSNTDFTFSYEVEVKNLEELTIDGLYGYVDTYYENNAPTILALKIQEERATPFYSEIIVGEGTVNTLKKEVIAGQIVIKDDKHSQKMIYKPFTGEIIVTGLMAGESDMTLFKLKENDHVISLSGKLADVDVFYVAQNGHLSKETINHLLSIYNGIYLDSKMEKPIDEETLFTSDYTITVGFKNDGIDEKLYLGTYYDSQNQIALSVEENVLYRYSNDTPILYDALLKNNGDVYIKTAPYDPIYKYIFNEDKFEIYSGDNYYIGDLIRYDATTQAIITINKAIGNGNQRFVINKGEIFTCTRVKRNEIQFYDIPSYSNTPITSDIVFNNVTIYCIDMIDFIYRIYGTHDHYFIIRTSWSVGKEMKDNQTTYYYEIYDNYKVTEIGWIEFLKYDGKNTHFLLHNEDGSNKIICYNQNEKNYTINDKIYTLNENPFKELEFIGNYIGTDGSIKTISEKGMLGTVKYTSVGNQVIDYEYVYIKNLKSDSVVFWYTYQTMEDELEIKTIQLTKNADGWCFEIDGIIYTQKVDIGV